MSAALTVSGLRVVLDGHPILTDIGLELAPGERVAVMGASGSGKTTLVRSIAGLQAAAAGRVHMDGELVSEGARTRVPPAARRLSLVFQDLALWPHLSARQHLRFVLGGQGLSAEERAHRIRVALDEVGLGHRAEARPAQLSGGERQRLALARALVTRPALLLLDEPFASLDLPLKLEMAQLLEQRHQAAGFALLHVTHDPLDALRTATRLLLLREGELVHDGPVSDLIHGGGPALSPLVEALRQGWEALH